MKKNLLSIVIVLTIIAELFVINSACAFPDMETHWAKNDVIELAKEGIISGVSATVFDPEGVVTREQFIKLLACTLNDKFDSSTTVFSDVLVSDWANAYIAYALENGLLVKDEYNGIFYKERPVSREEAAVWISRTLDISEKALTFEDAASIRNKSAVSVVVQAGIMGGFEDDTFRPQNNMTRAESAVIIKRILTYKEAVQSDITAVPSPSPVPASPLKIDGNRVAMGKNHIIILKNDGTVWTSGNNQYGQLGKSEGFSDSGKHFNTFSKVEGISDVTAVGAAMSASFAICSDKTVWSWGSNSSGILGTGTKNNIHVPKKIEGLENVRKISCGEYHVLALTDDGNVYAWGKNDKGQLGLPAATEDDMPENKDNPNYTKQSAEKASLKYRDIPVLIPNLSGVTDITAEEMVSYALKDDGSMWIWGTPTFYGTYSTILPKNFIDAAQPKNKDNTMNFKTISAASSVKEGASGVALKENGLVVSWGANRLYGNIFATQAYELKYPKLYENEIFIEPMIPIGDKDDANLYDIKKSEKFTDTKKVIACGEYVAALRNDGTVWCWGESIINDVPRVNVPYDHNSPWIPQKVEDLEDVIDIYSGYQFSALGEYYCGISNEPSRRLPIFNYTTSGVTMVPDYNSLPVNYKVIYNLVAIKNDGTVWMVGKKHDITRKGLPKTYAGKETEQIFDLN